MSRPELAAMTEPQYVHWVAPASTPAPHALHRRTGASTPVGRVFGTRAPQ
jgi:hypothetical protein